MLIIALTRPPRKSIPQPAELGPLGPVWVCNLRSPSRTNPGQQFYGPTEPCSTPAPPPTMLSTTRRRIPGRGGPASAAHSISPMGRARPCPTATYFLTPTQEPSSSAPSSSGGMAPPSTQLHVIPQP